ncbi:MAG: hypothetical protein U5N26_02245 [Candidatus Marinimicrobia bacterium]|nr:hypothetical protein [Candidatus Neomarinimicrobiota bacterium]
MKCEHVQELFPELLSQPDACPEAREHLKHCASCRTLFSLFRSLDSDEPAQYLTDATREENCRKIYKKMHRHDIFVFTRRVTGVAALFLIVPFSVFRVNTDTAPSLADIPDEVLYFESDMEIAGEPAIDKEAVIEYLAQNEPIEYLGALF